MKVRAWKWLQLCGSLLLATVQRWLHDQAPALAGALAYYTAFAISPLIGSLIVLLAWVYYSAQIVLFGAEFTREYASRFGASTSARAPHIETARRRKRKLYLDAASH